MNNTNNTNNTNADASKGTPVTGEVTAAVAPQKTAAKRNWKRATLMGAAYTAGTAAVAGLGWLAYKALTKSVEVVTGE